MTDLRTAPQQALEALEQFTYASNPAITALKAALAAPVQKTVAWIYTDPDKPVVKFLEWREDEPGYCGQWIKTPLYTAPPRCPNCASLQDQNTELDRKLAELEAALRAQS